MSIQDLQDKELEDITLPIQDLIRNGLMAIHKTLCDARVALDMTEHRVVGMMTGLQMLVDQERNRGTESKTGGDQGQG